MLAGRLSQRSVFNLGIGVITVICGYVVICQVYLWARGFPATLDSGTTYLFLGIAFAGIVLFLIGRRYTPVRLLDVDEQTMTLWFQNEEYAREFRKANALWIEVR
jgi:hypothetical protein